MKVRELRDHLNKISTRYNELEVKVWLPASTIRLSPMMLTPSKGHILIEGNIDPGSALESDNRWREKL